MPLQQCPMQAYGQQCFLRPDHQGAHRWRGKNRLQMGLVLLPQIQGSAQL